MHRCIVLFLLYSQYAKDFKNYILRTIKRKNFLHRKEDLHILSSNRRKRKWEDFEWNKGDIAQRRFGVEKVCCYLSLLLSEKESTEQEESQKEWKNVKQ